MHEQNKQNVGQLGGRNPNHETLIRVYRAEIHDDTGKVTITSDSLHTIEEKIGRVLGRTFVFEQITPQTQVILDRKGGATVGWITEMELPSSFMKNAAESEVPAQVAA